ncbi:MAG: 3-isopropylmalate dehydratase small subunit [Pirellula sp.]
MKPFTKLTGVVAAMDRANVDTDQIIPKQFLKRIERSGFGQYLFFDWRFDESGTPNPAFELNLPRNAGASILIARRNFGSGSSREHAVWAIEDYGIRSVIAPSFADIFYNNCFKNGVLPIALSESQIDALFARHASTTPYQLTVDLEGCVVTDDAGFSATFDVEPFRRHCLLHGLDDIGLTLEHEGKITAYEALHPAWATR